MKITINRLRDLGFAGKGQWYYEALVLDSDSTELLRVTAGSRAGAKVKAEREIEGILKNYNERAFFSGGDALFVVSFRHGSWGYDIIGPDGKSRGSCGTGEDFRGAKEAAKAHAEDYV